MQKEIMEALRKIFREEENISVAYMFGSHARKLNTQISDIDIAILLSETPKTCLNTTYTWLINYPG